MSTKDEDEAMLTEHSYPSPDAENFQELIYQKRDFHGDKVYPKDIKGNRLEQFRAVCTAKSVRKLTEAQVFVSKYVNPRTPYRGLLLFYGTGVGKTPASIACAENFKPYVEKYGNKIHVLVPGALNKENYIKEIIDTTGETYMSSPINKNTVVNSEEKKKRRAEAVLLINQYYRIMSHRSFVKKVVGEKTKERVVKNGKVKKVNKRGDDGEVERVYPVDRIFSLDNTLLIVDEAHGFTGNESGEALQQIMAASTNLKILLLTATPMKDSADSIVELINFIRPSNQQIAKDKVFTSQKSHNLQFKPGGKDYLRKMVRGYVSYMRGLDPLTFAEGIDMGEIPPGLEFTKVTRCFMKPFQLESYNYVIENHDDSFDRVSGAVSNFVWPGISKDSLGKLIGYYGIQGMYDIRNQLKVNPDKITDKICKELLDCDHPEAQSLMYLINNNKTISGDIYMEKYIDIFSIKFYETLKNLSQLVYGKRGEGLAFIYSNLRQVGVELFQEVLKMNGYLEYQENYNDYIIRPHTKCYFCGHDHEAHKSLPKGIPEHEFRPATFIMITGKSEDTLDQVPEEKFVIIDNVFNNPANSDGRSIKFILGSKVMNEGITLKNIKEIHILDVHYNLGRVDQVKGRGVRFCKHFDVMNEDNLYPKVRIYKYVSSMKGKLTTEEELYQKAEIKYKLVKETERILMEEAVDCPLAMAGNIFPEELEKYKDCNNKDKPCPAICGYNKCQYECADKALNAKYYDKDRHIYKTINKDKLDYSTYDISMAYESINEVKVHVKKMYQLHHVYTLKQIITSVKSSYPKEKRQLFDEQYVFHALDALIPISENDFNNFQDTIYDKFNRPGYLIYRGKYYIFQPFEENEDLPMFYRQNYRLNISNKLDVKDYIVYSTSYIEKADDSKALDNIPEFVVKKYDFDNVREYYDKKEENDIIIGIIDTESMKKRARNLGEIKDEFKIRTKRPKVVQKKRETGLPSFLGSACVVSKDRDYLEDIAKKLGIDVDKADIRQSICEMINRKLYDLEKYGTDNLTWLIIPSNHPEIPFPLNLKDRADSIVSDINSELGTDLTPEIKEHKATGLYKDISYKYYTIEYNDDPKYRSTFERHGASLTKGKYLIKID